MSVNINMKDLLEAGVHYGHQTRRMNPKSSKFVYGERNGIHIIDLQKTVTHFKKAVDFVSSVTANGGHILFVGTKRQARELVKEHAGRSRQFYMNHRWLGGTLTNFPTIRKSIHKLKKIEKMSQDGTYEKITKKEAINLERLREKLDVNLGGIKDMPGAPKAMFITDALKEKTALAEAKRLGIPVVAIVDTNINPEGIDYPIPGNDDSIKSLQLFIKTIADAAIAGRTKGKDKTEIDDDTKPVSKQKAGTIYDKEGHAIKVEKK